MLNNITKGIYKYSIGYYSCAFFGLLRICIRMEKGISYAISLYRNILLNEIQQYAEIKGLEKIEIKLFD